MRLLDTLRRVEGNPATQYKVHQFMSRIWIVMTPVAITVCVCWPAVWLKVSIVYVVIISHYANWAGDAGAMAAANAASDDDLGNHRG
jgi:hypothetical protein